MSFTRSTRNTSVHQGMPDYPSSEGYTTTTLKAAFDAPAEGLQNDLNSLMTELETNIASESIGADKLDVNDSSEANVQAKLGKLYEDMQSISQGSVADGAITQAKLDSTYEGTLAKKDGTLQTGLNAEQLGGQSLAQIQALITAAGHTIGTFTTTGAASYTLNLGYQPSTVIFINQSNTPALTSHEKYTSIGIIIGNRGKRITFAGKTNTFTATLSSNGITIPMVYDTSTNEYEAYTYSYIAFR